MKENILNNKYIQINFRDNGVFLITAIINSLICSVIFGVIGVVIGIITVLFSNIVYEVKKEEENIFYVWFLLCLVILGGAVGHLLKISVEFYLYIFAISYFYYISYDKDPYFDSTMPFILIFSCIGTVIPSANLDSILAYLTGITISLLCLSLLRHKNYDNKSFRNGLLARKIYIGNRNIFLRSFTYSFFLFLSLFLPDYFDLYRPYWAPLTFIILLRPKETDILKITCHRFIGSFLGALFVILLLQILNFKHIYIYFIILAAVIFILPSFFKMNYMLKTFAITIFVLLLLEKTLYLHDPNYQLPYSRIYETFIGGFVAILASILLKRLRQ
ncbi:MULTISPECIES: FUSC family protein [unclassified Acinetobacter]|uniref:FUSC family protein n=1 Tax=unclassified Acinetobacter TaxID=196816 RepID=UPI00293504CF|nr:MULTISPECIES: FUSC family protein [unclassified Acinetobacter]WOE30655.1 FUSC family protein [Acinetobacter sp. SAAs470]WOE38847.1 FUSC family protein [Acinetobacter sp. SAAs474]